MPDHAALTALVDSLDVPLVAAGVDGRVLVVNDAAEAWLGRSRQRLAGRPLAALDPHGPALSGLASSVVQSARRSEVTVDHEGRAWDVSGSAWWDGDRLVGCALAAHARRDLPAEDARSDVGVLAAGLAHEIRNPLAAVRGAAELLRADPSSAADYVDLILRETARVDALLARMLDLGRAPVLSFGRVPVADLLHDLALQARAFAAARGASCTVSEQFDPALPPIPGDRARLHEALVNLVKNAVEAATGHVELEARVDGDLRRRESSGRSRTLLRITVRDDGAGLGVARDRLFTPFFTTKSQGTGLGLLLARRTIEGHGGLFTLRDRAAGRGAEATVHLPIGDPS